MRLAERRGLLTGSHLSRVQRYALDLVLVLEAREKNTAAADAFKLAVISADPAKFIPITYPEWTVKKDEQITTDDLVESEGEWKFEEEVSKEDVEAILADLMRDPTITLSGDDLDPVHGVSVEENWTFPGEFAGEDTE